MGGDRAGTEEGIYTIVHVLEIYTIGVGLGDYLRLLCFF